jgi:hypothetical protein
MSPSTRARRLETIKFLTQDEMKRLFAVIHDKRDRALFLVACQHPEHGHLYVPDLDYAQREGQEILFEDGAVLRLRSDFLVRTRFPQSLWKCGRRVFMQL